MRTKEKNIDKSFIFVLITAFCFGTMEIALKLGGGQLFRAADNVSAISDRRAFPAAVRCQGCKKERHQDHERRYHLHNDTRHSRHMYKHDMLPVRRDELQCQHGCCHHIIKPCIYNDIRALYRQRAVYCKKGYRAGHQHHRPYICS